MLIYSKARLVISMLGVAFSVVVMFMEMGFFNGINDSQANLPPLLNADLCIIDHGRYSMNEPNQFNRLRLQQALAVDGVIEAIPLYEGMKNLMNPRDKRLRAIYVLAFPLESNALLVPGIEKYLDTLKFPRSILFDRLSRNIYGHLPEGSEVELGGEKHQVVGLVEIGPSIKLDGYVIMSDASWVLDGGNRDKVNVGLLRVGPGADVGNIKQKLKSALPDDVHLFTPEELRAREVNFTIQATPTGAVFGMGVIIGFVIGVIICYQILFNEIMDHLPQYATMKAIGFKKLFLLKLVMEQAFLLSLFGFIPGAASGFALYFTIQHLTGIQMFMTPARLGLIFTLTVFMCCCAGLLAVKKVFRADPAELF